MRVYNPRTDWQGFPKIREPGLCLSLERVDGEAQLVEISEPEWKRRWTGFYSSAPASGVAPGWRVIRGVEIGPRMEVGDV